MQRNKQISNFLKGLGYVHTETRTESYRCKPYDAKSLMYTKPRPDPEGEAEYTHTVKETVVDDFSAEDLPIIIMMEQQKAANTANESFASQIEGLRATVSQQATDIHTMRTILVVYAGLSVLGFVLSFFYLLNFFSRF